MTTEERLAEIHGRVDTSNPIDVMEYSYTYWYLRDVPWLLELVDKQNIQVSALEREKGYDEDEKLKLQERVRELEAASIKRGIADSEAGRVTPWSDNAP